MEDLFICDYCNQQFKNKQGLSLHKKQCKSNPDFQQQIFGCDFCGREFTTLRSKSLHQNQCKSNPNKIKPARSYKLCDKCGRYITSYAFNKHYQQCEGIVQPADKDLDLTYMNCRYCNKLFINQACLDQHEAACAIDHTCQYCGEIWCSIRSKSYHENYCQFNPNRDINPTSNLMWISNGIDMKYIQCDQEIPEGYENKRLESVNKKVSISNLGRSAWNKGLTATSDSRILSGYNHPAYGTHLSEETKYKISQSEIGDKHWHFGKTDSIETCMKRSIALKAYYEDNTQARQQISDRAKKMMSQISESTREKMSISAINRIINNGYSCRGKAGWYKGYHCMSSWELAYVIYNIEHNIDFQQNRQWFQYSYNDEVHRYLPDFIEGDLFVEIKGFYDGKVNAKCDQFPYKLKIIDKDNIGMYIDYATQMYGKDFINLYEQKDETMTYGIK